MAEEKKIGAIKEELQAAEDSMLPDFIARYEKDQSQNIQVYPSFDFRCTYPVPFSELPVFRI